jgi:hypothetical protein
MSPEWVTAIGTLGTFVVISASAVAALFQIRHLRSSNQIAALNECRETIQSAEFQAAERFVALELPERISQPEAQQALIEPFLRPEYEPVRMIGNFFENMGVFVKNRIIDREIACDLWQQVVLRNWQCIAPVCANRRVTLDMPNLWENFEYLASVCAQWDLSHHGGSYPRFAKRMPIPELWLVTRERTTEKKMVDGHVG